MKLVPRAQSLPEGMDRWTSSEPLWKRAPKRDSDGRAHTDFMLLAPGLNKRSTHEIECLMRIIQGVLNRFERWVVFADFNLKLNLLWISLKYCPGIMSEIVTALRSAAPELKLIAHNPEHRG